MIRNHAKHKIPMQEWLPTADLAMLCKKKSRSKAAKAAELSLQSLKNCRKAEVARDCAPMIEQSGPTRRRSHGRPTHAHAWERRIGEGEHERDGYRKKASLA